jgi:L-rhamnose mutarotase
MQFLVIIYTGNEKNGCIWSDVLRILLNVNGRVKEYKIFTDKARQHVFIFYSGMAQHKQKFFSKNVKAKLAK